MLLHILEILYSEFDYWKSVKGFDYDTRVRKEFLEQYIFDNLME